MKRLLAIAVLLSVAGLMCQTKVLAQSAVPPVPVRAVCLVNGVDYPVDYNSMIWGHDAYYNWAIIGQIVATPYGYRAIGGGMNYPAACGF